VDLLSEREGEAASSAVETCASRVVLEGLTALALLPESRAARRR